MACLGKVRQKWTNSQFCGFLPPKMRTTSRFLNLFEIVGWSKNMLDKWNSLAVELKEDLVFLDLHRVLIEELALFCNLIKSISKELKIKGIDKQTLANQQFPL